MGKHLVYRAMVQNQILREDTNMPNIPEYSVQTRDIQNNCPTGPQASPLDFDPFGSDGAQQLANGFAQMSDTGERQAVKEDMVWAQKQFTTAQLEMSKNVRNYTDPDAFAKDYDNY